MTTNVLVLEGKGSHTSADFVTVFKFDTVDEAVQFVELKNKPDGKYWTVATIITDGERVETTKEYFE